MLRWLALLITAAPFLLAQECTFVVTPTSISLSAAEATPQVTVNASRGGCAWAATSNVPAWVSVSFGQSGTNDGTVGLRVLANRDAVPRTGSVTIAGQTISINQAAASCTFQLNPEGATLNATGGNGAFQVNTTCNWQALTNSEWIDVTSPLGGRGTGSGQVTYTARSNSGASRTGSIQVGPLRFSVQQPTGTCSQALSSMQVSLPAAGGTGTVQVTSPCAWTAASGAAWIAITRGASGDRDGTLTYSVPPNSLAVSRSGTIRIGNQTYTVNQAGTGCAVSLTPTSVNLPATGGNGTIAIAALCAWTAIANDSWITVTPGTATVSYVVASNIAGSARTGSILIGDQGFTVSQAGGACSVSLSPVSAQVPGGGGAGNFLISSAGTCQWSVSTDAGWLSLNINSGQGSGTVIYTATANPGAPRSATVRVNAQSFTLAQTGQLPSFTAAGVLNAASFLGGSVGPGLIVTIFGTGLGPSDLTVAMVNPTTRVFPTELAGTRILFDSTAAPILYTSTTQVSAVVPFALAGGPVTRIEIESNGIRSPAVLLPVALTAPAIFTQSSQGFGPGAILNQDFSVNGPSNPAAPGAFVFIYATGGGRVEPPTANGALTQGTSSTIAPVEAFVDGQPVEVVYAGGAPELIAGVLQVNLRLPANLRPGDLPVEIRIAGSSSQTRVTISVR